MLTNFKDFVDNVIVENLHPELQDLVQSKVGRKSKQKELADKIKDLTSRGEKTGIEGNMPKGSSRAYMQHAEPENIIVDKKIVPMKVGTKVAIKSVLDRHHDRKEYGLSLGGLQNNAENGDHWVNNTFRTLTHTGNGHFETNTDRGIFPPLLEHDDKTHEWTKIGHARDVKAADWRKLTKTKNFPNGINHSDFVNTLVRFHDRNNGKYWEASAEREAHFDRVEHHPLVQKFLDYHGNTGNSPIDYRQQKNLGVWKHPVDGSEHIVARDHGFDTNVANAYSEANKRRMGI
jgi:hypothetical protein